MFSGSYGSYRNNSGSYSGSYGSYKATKPLEGFLLGVTVAPTDQLSPRPSASGIPGIEAIWPLRYYGVRMQRCPMAVRHILHKISILRTQIFYAYDKFGSDLRPMLCQKNVPPPTILNFIVVSSVALPFPPYAMLAGTGPVGSRFSWHLALSPTLHFGGGGGETNTQRLKLRFVVCWPRSLTQVVVLSSRRPQVCVLGDAP